MKKKVASKKSKAVKSEAIDKSLSSLPKSLVKKLQSLNSQIQVGDLRSLGLRVLDRAKAISSQIKSLPKKVKAKSLPQKTTQKKKVTKKK